MSDLQSCQLFVPADEKHRFLFIKNIYGLDEIFNRLSNFSLKLRSPALHHPHFSQNYLLHSHHISLSFEDLVSFYNLPANMGMLFSETAHKSDTNSPLLKISIVINIMTKTNMGKKWFVSSYNSQITHHNVNQDRNSLQKLGGKNSSKSPWGVLLIGVLLERWICFCKYPEPPAQDWYYRQWQDHSDIKHSQENDA